MSLKKVDAVKADKGFKIFDLIIYGGVIALAVILFTVLFVTKSNDQVNGFRIYLNNTVVYEYSFNSGEKFRDKCVQTVEDNEKLVITVSADGGEFNTVEIGKDGYVKMINANCGKKDCVYTPELSVSGIIYCPPHALRIVPLNLDEDDGNIIIGTP